MDVPRLTCAQCKKRKLRCDKLTPCSACRNAGLVCQTVQRARLPRGKSGKSRKQKQTLESRVTNLETLLKQHSELNTSPTTFAGSTGTVRSPNAPGGQIIATDFWSALSESISGLREMLEDSEDETEDGSTVHMQNCNPEETEGTPCMQTGLLFPSLGSNQHTTPPFTSLNVSKVLLNLYRTRVDTVYKIVHWPTTVTLVESNRTNPSPSISNRALEHAIYFMALCTLTDAEAYELGLGVRAELLRNYRSAAESFLTSSDLLKHPDVYTVQAFVIYLVGLRTCLNSATTWTLIAIAVRATTSLGLGDEDAKGFTPFDLEVRRRLLYAIGILDTHSALDRGTIPMLPSTAFRHPPLDVNDDELSPLQVVCATPSLGVTDMTHAMMSYQAMLCQRRMYELSHEYDENYKNWPRRLQLVADFGWYVQKVCIQTCDSPTPLNTLLKISGKKIHVSLELLLRRPPYRQPHNTVPPWDDYDIMLAATDVLEHHLQAPPPELGPWAWKNWVQWHALAVVLAELVVKPQGPSFARAYTIATKSFQYYARIVADSQSGMLWKPIAKLMRRVQCSQQSSAVAQKTLLPDHMNDLENTLRSSHPTLLKVDDNFDFSHWNVDNQATVSFTDDISRANQDSPLDYDDMSWLAWDSFLSDMIDITM